MFIKYHASINNRIFNLLTTHVFRQFFFLLVIMKAQRKYVSINRIRAVVKRVCGVCTCDDQLQVFSGPKSATGDRTTGRTMHLIYWPSEFAVTGFFFLPPRYFTRTLNTTRRSWRLVYALRCSKVVYVYLTLWSIAVAAAACPVQLARFELYNKIHLMITSMCNFIITVRGG